MFQGIHHVSIHWLHKTIIARHALGQETWRLDLDYTANESVHLICIHTSAKILCLASQLKLRLKNM